MPYPQPSDWTSSAPLSGWYLDRSVQPTKVCSSDGWNLLASLQSALFLWLQTSGSLATFDGSQIDSSSIDTNDPASPQTATGWDQTVLRALYAVAQRLNADSSFLSAIQNDASTGIGPISAGTLQIGIWIADFGQVSSEGVVTSVSSSPANIAIPDGTIYPRMETAPPLVAGATSGGAGSRCNAIPPNVEALIPVSQTVVPYQFNELLIFGIIAAVAVAFVVLSKDVPVISREAQERKEITRSRRNPRRVGRRHARYRSDRYKLWYEA